MAVRKNKVLTKVLEERSSHNTGSAAGGGEPADQRWGFPDSLDGVRLKRRTMNPPKGPQSCLLIGLLCVTPLGHTRLGRRLGGAGLAHTGSSFLQRATLSRFLPSFFSFLVPVTINLYDPL